MLVSAAILPGIPRRISLRWSEGRFGLIASSHLLHELQAVLSRKKFRRYLTYGEALEYVLWLREGATLVEEGETQRVTADPDDDYLIALAKTSGADLIVSGDRHLLELEGEGLPRVVLPAGFLEELEKGRP